MNSFTSRIYLLVVLLSFGSVVFSQQNVSFKIPYEQNQSGSKVYFNPEKPIVGDTIRVRFIPGPDSEVKNADSLYLEIQFLYANMDNFYMREFLMKKDENQWQTKFLLDNPDIGSMSIQFATPDYIVDCNNRKGWDLMVFDKNGNPVKGAYRAYANGYMFHGVMRKKQDME